MKRVIVVGSGAGGAAAAKKAAGEVSGNRPGGRQRVQAFFL